MKNQLNIVVFLILLSACAPKFNFNTAYKFSTAKLSTKTERIQNDEVIQSEIPLLASTKSREILLAHPDFFNKIENRLKELELAENVAEEKAIARDIIKGISKEEKRAIKKEITNELKVVRNDYKNDTRAVHGKNDSSTNWAATTGLILGILAILGLIVPGLIFLSIPGLIFSIVGLKSEKKTMAIIGLALNALAFILLLAVIIVVASWL